MNTEHKQLRELSPSEIEEILRRCSHAHLGCSRGGEIIWGRFQELKNGTEAERGLRLLKMKICEILQRRDVTPLEVELEAILSEAKIYRINIEG
jgi:nitroimidazol reductase NimA-like FMN-containing flavoprotein (pyridoxamine 5'-phosphate oxidase superfamily)